MDYQAFPHKLPSRHHMSPKTLRLIANTGLQTFQHVSKTVSTMSRNVSESISNTFQTVSNWYQTVSIHSVNHDSNISKTFQISLKQCQTIQPYLKQFQNNFKPVSTRFQTGVKHVANHCVWNSSCFLMQSNEQHVYLQGFLRCWCSMLT